MPARNLCSYSSGVLLYIHSFICTSYRSVKPLHRPASGQLTYVPWSDHHVYFRRVFTLTGPCATYIDIAAITEMGGHKIRLRTNLCNQTIIGWMPAVTNRFTCSLMDTCDRYILNIDVIDALRRLEFGADAECGAGSGTVCLSVTWH